MAILSKNEVERDRILQVASRNKCGERDLLWDTTKNGKPYMYDFRLATPQEVQAFEGGATAGMLFARRTDTYGLVFVAKHRPHRCPESEYMKAQAEAETEEPDAEAEAAEYLATLVSEGDADEEQV